jgi:hypothetical protein
MTKQEAEIKFNEAVRNRNWARNRRDEAYTERNKRETERQHQKKIKKDLEERRDDLNRIIRFFDNSLSDQIKNTNNKAKNADDAYCAAIFCSGESIPNASISDAFRTKSVSGDPDTSGAYTACVNERNRTKLKIVDAENAIAQMKREYDYWDFEYRKYNNLASEYQWQINYYDRYR